MTTIPNLLYLLLQNWAIVLIVALIGYLIGSVNPAIIVTKMFLHKDIRQMGSGNAGFTNVLRSVGTVPAVMTLLFDFFKGAFAAFLGSMVFAGFTQEASLVTELSRYGAYAGGLTALLGHMFPVYFKFKGGKGVTVAASLMLVTDVRVFFMILLSFGLCFLFTRIISLSSVICAVLYPAYTFLFLYFSDMKNPPQDYIPVRIEYVIACTVITAVIGILVIIKHRSNIVRIIKGTEKKIEPKKREKKKPASDGRRLGDDK